MKTKLMLDSEKAVTFIQNMFHIYLEERSFPLFLTMLDPEISWVGSDRKGVYANYEETVRLLLQEQELWKGHFKIEYNQCLGVPLNEDFFMVYGALKLTADDADVLFFNEELGFTTVLVKREETFKLYHMHLALFNPLLRAEALAISKARYEIAIDLAGIDMFEYDVITGEIVLPEKTAKLYGVSPVVSDGVEFFIRSGFIEPDSIADYKNMYEAIKSGVPFAKAEVNSKSENGIIRAYEVSLTGIFDPYGNSVKAIGVVKNITKMRLLQREKKFGATFASNKYFVCEADVTSDEVLQVNPAWSAEIGKTEDLRFSEFVRVCCERFIDSAHREMVIRRLSKAGITKAYEWGDRLTFFAYRRKYKKGTGYHWFEATVNMIKDEVTGHISLRYYLMDINDAKQKEQKALEDKCLYEAVRVKSMISYDIDITGNLMISGHEDWVKLYGIKQPDNYTDLIHAFCEKEIHPEDKADFLIFFDIGNVRRAYENGERQLSLEYRRPDNENHFLWVRCILQLYEDPELRHIRAYAHVENIDKEKRNQLALIYKSEHDLLTQFYNKSMTEKLIDEFLNTGVARAAKHAFFIIDIDHFKIINDTYGHAFGDAVLSQVSAKIGDLFREGDIVGRIGGDEFAALMKFVPCSQIARGKAQEICQAILSSDMKGGNGYNMSVSIGVALYDRNGKTYESLYKHSDAALYAAKRKGRNCFCLYQEGMDAGLNPATAIDHSVFLEEKSFEENVLDYVFRILYESTDLDTSISGVLGLLGKHYGISRTYIFLDSPDGKETGLVYEWCDRGIPSQREAQKSIPYDRLDACKTCFNAQGVYCVPDTGLVKPVAEAILTEHTKGTVQFSITKHGRFYGFIGIDQCEGPLVLSKQVLSDCRNIARVLGVFALECKGV